MLSANTKSLVVYFTILIITKEIKASRTGNRLCGSQLADTLRLVCQGMYHGPSKRSADSSSAIVSKIDESTLHLLRRRRQSSQSIVEECCDQPCDLTTLQLYCASSVDLSTLLLTTQPPSVLFDFRRHQNAILTTPDPDSVTTGRPPLRRPLAEISRGRGGLRRTFYVPFNTPAITRSPLMFRH